VHGNHHGFSLLSLLSLLSLFRVSSSVASFLDPDRQHGPVELAPQPIAFMRELGDLQRFGAVGWDLGVAILWCQGGQIACFALTPPSAQRGGVNDLSAHQRIDFAGAGAAVGGIQNAALSALKNCRRRACGTIFVMQCCGDTP